MTLQDLKDRIQEIEKEVFQKGFYSDEVPLQSNYFYKINIDMRVADYLGHIYIQTDINPES